MLTGLIAAVESAFFHALFDELFKWCIKNRLRRPTIFFVQQLGLRNIFDDVSSLDEMAFLCEAISHIDKSEDYWEKRHISDKLYQCIHTNNPLYVKYLVEALMAQGWDINSKFGMVVYGREEIKEIVNESLYSQWKKPDPAIWQEREPLTGSYSSSSKAYKCIGTLAALLKVNKRYDTLYLLLTSFPQFEKSCAPLFNIEPSDLPDFLLISAYKAYKFTD